MEIGVDASLCEPCGRRSQDRRHARRCDKPKVIGDRREAAVVGVDAGRPGRPYAPAAETSSSLAAQRRAAAASSAAAFEVRAGLPL